MNEQKNVQRARDAYSAFGSGNIQAILDLCSDDVRWITPGQIPSAGDRTGRIQVGEFFQLIGRDLDFATFEPKEFVATGDTVVVLGSYTGTVRPTGKGYAADWAHVFRFRDGKISGFQEITDTQNLAAAWS